VQLLRPAVERLVEDLLDALPAEGDFVSSFAFPAGQRDRRAAVGCRPATARSSRP